MPSLEATARQTYLFQLAHSYRQRKSYMSYLIKWYSRQSGSVEQLHLGCLIGINTEGRKWQQLQFSERLRSISVVWLLITQTL